MKAAELKLGRTFAVSFEDGEDFLEALQRFCTENNVRQGYLPMFVAALRTVTVVGACEAGDDPNAPVWERSTFTYAETFGVGTIADGESGISPHIHLSVGLKHGGAVAKTSHLLSAEVQFLAELLIVEVTEPKMTRPINTEMYSVPVLTYGTGAISTPAS